MQQTGQAALGSVASNVQSQSYPRYWLQIPVRVLPVKSRLPGVKTVTLGMNGR